MIYYSKDLCSYVHNLGSWESKARKSSGLKEMEQFKPVFFPFQVLFSQLPKLHVL